MPRKEVSNEQLKCTDEIFHTMSEEEHEQTLVSMHLEVLNDKIDKFTSYLDQLIHHDYQKLAKPICETISKEIQSKVLLPEEVNRWVRTIEFHQKALKKNIEAKYKKKVKSLTPERTCPNKDTSSKNQKKTYTGSVTTSKNKPSFWKKLKTYWANYYNPPQPPMD